MCTDIVGDFTICLRMAGPSLLHRSRQTLRQHNLEAHYILARLQLVVGELVNLCVIVEDIVVGLYILEASYAPAPTSLELPLPRILFDTPDFKINMSRH